MRLCQVCGMTLSPFAEDLECNSAPFPNTQSEKKLELLPNTQIEVNLHCVNLLNTYMECNNTTLPKLFTFTVDVKLQQIRIC